VLYVTILLWFTASTMTLYGVALYRRRYPSGGSFTIALLALAFIAAYQLTN